ncbi:myosin-9 [Planoprotostelium fungivorum]|uniref:Myosin-9 n=1 Tax=Planoprotostelium fungivorum TaxID=1890364 RepID=A0A2P6NF43_9EUKA|nr:myosin-9 [Planoprotostelium fungivorum]
MSERKKKQMSISVTEQQLDTIHYAKEELKIQSSSDANIVKAILDHLPSLFKTIREQKQTISESQKEIESLKRKKTDRKSTKSGVAKTPIKRKKPYDEKTSLTSKYNELDDILLYLQQRHIPLSDLNYRNEFIKKMKEKTEAQAAVEEEDHPVVENSFSNDVFSQDREFSELHEDMLVQDGDLMDQNVFNSAESIEKEGGF